MARREKNDINKDNNLLAFKPNKKTALLFFLNQNEKVLADYLSSTRFSVARKLMRAI